MRKSLHILFSAVAVLLVSAASYAIADSATRAPRTRTVTIASATSTITACVNNKTHQMYAEAKCPKGYSKVSWNEKGPAGPAGANGAAGAPGRDGTNGSNGTNGTAASITVGSVATGAAGSNASVTNVGTSSAARFNFTIPKGADGTNGTNGTDGANGAAGTAPWGTPVALSPSSGTSTRACPYVASSGSNAGTPATAITWEGSLYEYVGSSCQYVGGGNGGTPDYAPSNWTQIAAAGANGTADVWAVIDPGVCAAGGSCTSPVISHGGVAGSGVSFGYNNVGQYHLDITGCPAADTPAAGHAFPAAVTVTPEGAYPGESSHDSSVIAVSSSVRDTTSLGVAGGLGTVDFYLYLGTPDQSVIGQTDSVDEPFAVMVNC